jgi:hypothetical protein
LNSSLNG